jgi:SAM-dependent methyltransferase
VDGDQLIRRFYPEANVGGFSHVDGTISFFNHLVAIVRPTDIILDYGAGRGQPLIDDEVVYRRNIGNFKGRCRHIDGCDIDPVVLQNPFVDAAKVIRNGERLPYEDDRFDIVVARHVFEHIEAPEFAAQELLRVVKPGGIIAATTPNKWGYIALSARMVPNKHHVRVLSQGQPDRKPEDVFPTQYKLNTARDLRKVFGGGADIFIAKKASEPGYHFGRPWLFWLFKTWSKHSPDALLPVLDVYVRKH